MGLIPEDSTGRPRALEWGSASRALEHESGDLAVVVDFSGGVLVGIIDGLGHGPEAAEASREAAQVLRSQPGDPVDVLVRRCHEALHATRGVVMTLASFRMETSTLTWVAVGNADAMLLRRDIRAPRPREAVTLRGGVVGYQLPPLRPASHLVAPGDVLIMVTDGIGSGYVDQLRAHGDVQDIAHGLLTSHVKGTDDALVLVARYRGPGP